MVCQVTIAGTRDTPQANVRRMERVIHAQGAIRNMPTVRIYKAVRTSKDIMHYPLFPCYFLEYLLH